MSTDHPNYYALLGVDSQAAPEEIRKAFAGLQAQYGKKKDTGGESSLYQQIRHAYEVLSDPERRAVYDSLLDETSSPLLQIKTQASRDKIPILNTIQLVYLLVDVQPFESEEKNDLPLNLCLVIDRSTSMRGERLDRVKAAVEMVLEKLGPDDMISVISFSDRAEIVLPAGKVAEKFRLISKIKGITAAGGTEIYQGLWAGINEMEQAPLKHHHNHLILLTDGHTYGDADKCLQLAKRVALQSIGITAFGIGVEWNDQFLDQLVAPSGGQSAYIDQPEEIITFMQKRIKGLGTIFARNSRLLLDLPQNVHLQYGFKLAPYAQPLSLGEQEIKLGDIEGRKPLSFLLELGIDPQPIETRIKIPLQLTAELPGQQMQTRSFKQTFRLLVLSEAPAGELPESLLRAVHMLNMYRLNERVWEDVEAGQLEAATQRMRHLTTRFLEAGQTKLAQQAHMEAERLAQMGTVSPEGHKTLKFGTRALLSQVITWEQDE